MQRLVVIEVNEIPISVLKWYADTQPDSTIASLMQPGCYTTTNVAEEADRELYPSQTWATLAMGVPFEKHQVYWYGDPKPEEFPLYWQHAAAHCRVGVMGTLHSSPLGEQPNLDRYVFAVPDAFATDDQTVPAELQPLQAFNLAMTRRNSRAVASARPFAEYAAGLRTTMGVGIRPSTFTKLGALAGGVATKRIPKERLRTGQFLLFADVFLRQLTQTEPDLAVFFTNHVAASLHRYWPASFPNDWDDHPFGDEWIERFSDEIPFALRSLDNFLGEIMAYATRTGRTVVLTSSMGQRGGLEVERGNARVLVADDGTTFARSLGIDAPFELLNAMAPHLSIRFDSVEAATAAQAHLANTVVDGTRLGADRADTTVTITYQLQNCEGTVQITTPAGTSEHDPQHIGLGWREVSEYRSGRHIPHGSLVVGNGTTSLDSDGVVEVTEVAPAILAALGVPALGHHCEPTFNFEQ